jgi:hypothetical protein
MKTLTKDMFTWYLDGIRSYSTSVVTPEHFNRIINDAQDVFVNENLGVNEVGQRQIDNLRVLLTDKVWEGSGLKHVLPADYLRAASVKVMFPEVDKCIVPAKEWLDTVILKQDMTSLVNPYRRPGPKRRYHQFIGNELVLVVGKQEVSGVKLTYYKKPRVIYFDKVKQEDRDGIVIAGSLAAYTPGAGSVPPVFPEQQCRMIVSIAVRVTLENRQNPRYQSYLNEETLRDRRM